MIRLIRFFVGLSGRMMVVIVAASLLVGAANTALLATLNRVLAAEGAVGWLMAAFVLAALFKLGTSFASDVLVVRFSAATLARLRDRLAYRITRAPLRRVEALGNARLVALLTDDIDALNTAYVGLPYVGAQAAMLLGGAVYLALLSPSVLAMLVVFCAVAVSTQRAALRASRSHLEKARALDDRLMHHFWGLTAGLKQLKMHRGRRRQFLEEVDDISRSALSQHVRSDVRFSVADHATQVSLYLLLGLLVFGAPSLFGVDWSTLTGYALTIVFLMGPLRALLSGYGHLLAAGVAVERLERLGNEVNELMDDTGDEDDDAGRWQPSPLLASQPSSLATSPTSWLQVQSSELLEASSVAMAPPSLVSIVTQPSLGAPSEQPTSRAVASCMSVRSSELFESLRGVAVEVSEASPRLAPVPSGDVARGGFREIRLEAVELAYDRTSGFRLGPIDGRICPGESVFVTGGNGCGKTTLAKLLSGLYEPDRGRLVWDGVGVDSSNRDEFRQLFSGVFADHHLFDRPVAGATEAEVLELLRRFELDHRVRYEQGRFADLELSRGQRARLAFALAELEDRPIYVFDEWAAEQDPTFRRRFYREFLPALKARQKTLFVITHDDRFFHLADRIWQLREGRCDERSPDSLPAHSVSA